MGVLRLSSLLQRHGHRALAASNGIAALRVLETTSVDVILTDIVMPDMEGLEFLRTVRHRALPPKVIAMSGGGFGSFGDYLELAVQLGADATLSKPFSAAELGDTVQRMMSAA